VKGGAPLSGNLSDPWAGIPEILGGELQGVEILYQARKICNSPGFHITSIPGLGRTEEPKVALEGPCLAKSPEQSQAPQEAPPREESCSNDY
jgi:hypothetical protein